MIIAPVKIRSRFKVVKDDPDDDVILRTAKDGRANYIVAGDKHLLSLGEFRGIKIVTVNEMLKLLKEGRITMPEELYTKKEYPRNTFKSETLAISSPFRP